MDQKQSIDLSIVIPVFNGEKTIEKCLRSLCVESTINYEIIIINDNSFDKTALILQNYSEDNANITIIDNTKNLGVGLSRNKGIQKSKGEYIAFVDSDDWVDLNLFPYCIETLRKTKAEIGIFGVVNEYENSFTAKPRYTYSNQLTMPTRLAIDILSRNQSNNEYISPMVCQKIYKRKFIVDHELFFVDNRYFEDDIFTFLSLTHEANVTLIPNVMYHYRQLHNSNSHLISNDYIKSFSLAFLSIKNELINKGAFEEMKSCFYSYFDKSLFALLSVLFSEEQNALKQKEYINELFVSLKGIIPLKDFIDHIDVNRFCGFWK